MEREELILALREVTDLERIIGRVVYGSANARDLASLATGLGRIPKLRELCAAVDAPLIAEVRQGLDDLTALREELERAISACFPARADEAGSLLTDRRQEDAASRALDAVRRALEALETGMTPDAVLTDAEEALDALGELTGRTAKEEIVSRIFSRFCVGK